MLTVRVMSTDGTEVIHCGKCVGFNPEQQSIAVAGMGQHIFLQPGDRAYVMNANARTIARYIHPEITDVLLKPFKPGTPVVSQSVHV